MVSQKLAYIVRMSQSFAMKNFLYILDLRTLGVSRMVRSTYKFSNRQPKSLYVSARRILLQELIDMKAIQPCLSRAIILIKKFFARKLFSNRFCVKSRDSREPKNKSSVHSLQAGGGVKAPPSYIYTSSGANSRWPVFMCPYGIYVAATTLN